MLPITLAIQLLAQSPDETKRQKGENNWKKRMLCTKILQLKKAICSMYET